MAYSNITDPSEYFQTLLYTGSGSASDVTNTGNSDLQPDLVWTKLRNSNNGSHNVSDSTRGVSTNTGKYLRVDATDAEADDANGIRAFNTNGFKTGDGWFNGASGSPYVAWQWKANGGTTSSNTDGDITSTVQANTTAGFSIVTYTGNTSNNQTVGHGLGAVPSVIIIRNRTRVENWRLNHRLINSGTGMIILDTDAAYNTTGTTLMNSAATSSVFNVSTDWSVNGNYPFVAYCFAQKNGYSAFGKYKGNGAQNGTFVYTGFKPAFIIMKRTDTTGAWHLFDSKRSGYNYANDVLQPNALDAELSGQTYQFVDILSNGFKVRRATHGPNISGGTYLYWAIAENPFVANGIPTTAR